MTGTKPQHEPEVSARSARLASVSRKRAPRFEFLRSVAGASAVVFAFGLLVGAFVAGIMLPIKLLGWALG